MFKNFEFSVENIEILDSVAKDAFLVAEIRNKGIVIAKDRVVLTAQPKIQIKLVETKSKQLMKGTTLAFDAVLKITCNDSSGCYRKNSKPFALARQTVASVRNMFGDPKYSDFTFVVKGREFKVHKNILAPRSSMMDTLFSSGYEEGLNNVCKVEDIDPDIFELLLKFVYGVQLPLNISDSAMKLFEAAHYYQIEDLTKFASQEIHFNLSLVNCLDIYVWAFPYDIEDLKHGAWKLVKR
jgi:hypothetical protein